MDGRRKNYRAWDPQQNGHDAISPHQALPEGDLVFFLIDLIPQLDLAPFYAYYDRRPPRPTPLRRDHDGHLAGLRLLPSASAPAARSPPPASATWPSAPSSATIAPTSAPSATSASSTRRP